MKKIEQTDEEAQSLDIVAENIEKLKQLFPQIVEEDTINFEALQQLLGEEVEVKDEYYRFTWPGKHKARQEALKTSTGTLRPAPEESINWRDTENLYIEGDNLEVLKLLQRSYARKVKMIYIDPPYNTGKDFVYKDNYKDNLKEYNEKFNRYDEEGNLKSSESQSNAERHARYHSNWLNMMYPRLHLARNLLRDDGVIFISIDDHEVHNLRRICDETFGEENFVANVIWERAFAPKNDAKYFSDSHDHILVFAKDIMEFDIGKLERTDEANSRYKNLDDDPRGPWTSDNLTVKTYSEAYDYEIITPSGRKVSPTNGRCWFTSQDRMQNLIGDNRIWFGKDGNNVPRLKRFLSEVQSGMVPISIWPYSEVGHNQEGRQEVKKLFKDKGYFDGPKPIRLLTRILTVANLDEDSIVLDFFAGSSSTAHAVLDLNKYEFLEGKISRRKFIMVQLPEHTEENSDARQAGYNTIADIGKERIRKVGQKIKEELKEAGKDELIEKLDLGFKVFKLDSSNIHSWSTDPEDLEVNLFQDQVIKDERTAEDVLYEILLKYGFDLTLPIEEATVARKKVYNVGGAGQLLVCLDDGIDRGTAQALIDYAQEDEIIDTKVVFKDAGFVNDVEKTNVYQLLKSHGIENVKTI